MCEQVWHVEYDKALGAPVSNATLDGTKYTRKFASGAPTQRIALGFNFIKLLLSCFLAVSISAVTSSGPPSDSVETASAFCRCCNDLQTGTAVELDLSGGEGQERSCIRWSDGYATGNSC